MPQDPAAAASLPPPYGIGDRELRSGFLARWRPWLAIVLLGAPLLAALSGFLGGGPERMFRAASPQAVMTIATPGVLRSGNWFETRIVVEPRADIADLTVAIDDPLWRGMSIDTLVPDAEKAESKDDSFAYGFGPVKAGERFVLKIDGQIQPRGLRRLRGDVTLRDGDRPLASAPVSIQVLP